MTIKITVELPDTMGFLPGTPLELAGRVFHPLKGEAWEAAVGMFAAKWMMPSLTTTNPFRDALEAGAQHGVTFLPKEEQAATFGAMMYTVARLTDPNPPAAPRRRLLGLLPPRGQ